MGEIVSCEERSIAPVTLPESTDSGRVTRLETYGSTRAEA